MSSFSHWLMEEEWGSQSGSSYLQGFFRLVYTNLKSFRTSCDTQASLLSLFWETDLPLYAWGPVYYRDRSLTETYSEPSVSLLFFYRNRDTLNAPEPSSGMNTTPKFFAESRGTENSRLNKLSPWEFSFIKICFVTNSIVNLLSFFMYGCCWSEAYESGSDMTITATIRESFRLCPRTLSLWTFQCIWLS